MASSSEELLERVGPGTGRSGLGRPV